MKFDVAVIITVAINIIISLTTLFLIVQDKISRQEEEEEDVDEIDPDFLSKNLDSRLRDLQTRRFSVTMDPRPRFRHIDKKEK